MVQKIEFLEAEVRELKQRESKQKVIHAQMIEAINQQKAAEHVETPEQIPTLNESTSQAQLLELEQMYQS
jgi:hypothetical protein